MSDYTNVVRRNLHYLDPIGAHRPLDNPTFGNPPFDGASPRVLIVRLSPFRDVDRSLPHLFLFQEVRRARPDAYIDLAFFPSQSERELFDRERIPYLLGAQSLRSADDFHLVLISNAYTLELINLPLLLLRSQIPLFASERDEAWPIVILGGSNAGAAQALIRPDGDSLVDGLFVGEGEGRVADLVTTLLSEPADKHVRLRAAAERVEGFWPAGELRPIAKAVACAPTMEMLPASYPLLNTPEVHAASLPISMGCPAFCSFCFEGYDRKPYRELPLDDLLQGARRIKREQGCVELSLYSFNFNTHSDVLPLLLELHALFDRVSFLSQRADILQHIAPLLQAEVEADKQSFTLGVEGISARMRAWLHKSLPTEDLLALLERMFALRIREIKLFYLLTGHEDEEDVAEFRDLIRRVKEMRRAGNRGIRVIFSAGLLIRMPGTPLRYDRLFLDPAHWRLLIGQVKSACETNGFEWRMAFDWEEYRVSQALALGGYWLADPLVTLAREGYLYDTRLPPDYGERFFHLLEREGRLDAAFLGEKGPDYPFALDWVRSDVSPTFLYDQYRRAQEGEDRGYCLGGVEGNGACLGCGACVSSAQRAAIVEHRPTLPEMGPYMAQLRDRVRRKRKLPPVYIHIRLAPWFAALQAEFANAALARFLLARCPDQTENLLAASESLFTLRANAGFPLMGGETVFALKAWDGAELLGRLLAAPTDAGTPTPPAIEVLGPAEGFDPGEFRSLELHLHLPTYAFPEPRRILDLYLRQAYVPYSLRRQDAPEVDYAFDVPAKGLKKKALLGGRFATREEGWDAVLELGPKFDLLAFLGGFGHPGLYRQAGMVVSHLRWR